jgi:dihydroorotase
LPPFCPALAVARPVTARRVQKTPGRIPPARDRDRWDHVGRAHLGLACARPIAYGAVMVDRLTLPRPDDWHLHLRDGAMLRGVLPETARDFGRALIMPNLVPPVVTGADALAYRDRIRAALPPGSRFTPLMTLYLTEATDPDDVVAAARNGVIAAVKLYPAGATTNSDAGVRVIDRVRPVLEAMAGAGIPLCVHGEVTDPEIDIFDREAVFIDRVLDPLRRATPGLRVVMEHVTTRQGVDYVRDARPGTSPRTLTVHHLILNRTDMLAGGIRPHFYCLPVAEARHPSRRAGGRSDLGPSAPVPGHRQRAPCRSGTKESACGCAGIFTAPVALPLLAALFEAHGACDRLADFTSLPRRDLLPGGPEPRPRGAGKAGRPGALSRPDRHRCRAGHRLRPGRRLPVAGHRNPGGVRCAACPCRPRTRPRA